MLQEQTLQTSTLELLKKLMSDSELVDFYLVGGTALALRIGHRISIDLDLFTCNLFDKYKWLDTSTIDGIRLAGIKDICAMKLNSIAGNGTRIKDFIDLAYLSQHYSLRQMLGFFEEKYNANPVMVLKAITFFDEINYNEPVKLCNATKLNWKKIVKRLSEMTKYIDKKFSEPPL